jgi:hypothetical protein
MESSGQLHAPPLYLLEKSPLLPLDSRLGGPQSRPVRCVEDKNLSPALQSVVRHYTDWAHSDLEVQNSKKNGILM